VAECHPRRFRLGDKKEAAGVCRGCGESMEIESEHTRNQMFSSIKESRFKRALQAHTPIMALSSVRGACGFVLVG
jgi:hypothetical protein